MQQRRGSKLVDRNSRNFGTTTVRKAFSRSSIFCCSSKNPFHAKKSRIVPGSIYARANKHYLLTVAIVARHLFAACNDPITRSFRIPLNASRDTLYYARRRLQRRKKRTKSVLPAWNNSFQFVITNASEGNVQLNCLVSFERNRSFFFLESPLRDAEA